MSFLPHITEPLPDDSTLPPPGEQPSSHFSPDEPEPMPEDEVSTADRLCCDEAGLNPLAQPCSDIHVLTVIGQVEGHLLLPEQNKTSKYEHIIPQLVAVEQSRDIKALLVVLNTVGGDVEAGLAIAEMIASLSKPTAALVLGGGHSIGVSIAAAAERSFIAPTASMTVHPIRMTGMVVGVQQSFDYLEKMQERITGFVCSHSRISTRRFRQLMMTTGELAHDVGTVLVGAEAVDCGLIDCVGGLREALDYLRGRIADGGESAPTLPRRRRPAIGDRPPQKPPLIVERHRSGISRRQVRDSAGIPGYLEQGDDKGGEQP